MGYIAFFDMLGTRAAAMIGHSEYSEAISTFTKALKQVSAVYDCSIYGYSDNAYAEIATLSDTISFFRDFRLRMINTHCYFNTAVDKGTLCPKKISFGRDNKGYSIIFTHSSSSEIYLKQCAFEGIGISLSKRIVEELIAKGKNGEFCCSVFQPYHSTGKELVLEEVYDLSYDPISLTMLNYVMADYLMTVATNVRASRYYLTPIVSMIKCLDKEIILNELDDLISLLCMKDVPDAFKQLSNTQAYLRIFVYAALEYVLSQQNTDDTLDTTSICAKIIQGCGVKYPELLQGIAKVPTAVISNRNKKELIAIMYGMGINSAPSST